MDLDAGDRAREPFLAHQHGRGNSVVQVAVGGRARLTESLHRRRRGKEPLLEDACLLRSEGIAEAGEYLLRLVLNRSF